MFSDAISSILSRWRFSSSCTLLNSSGSAASSPLVKKPVWDGRGAADIKASFATMTGAGADLAPPRRNGGFTPSAPPNLAFRQGYEDLLARHGKSWDFPLPD